MESEEVSAVVVSSASTSCSFVIVSSDSDFTPLSIYLKESGVYVIGFGKSDASEAFKNGCDEFKDIEKIPTSESNSQHLKNTSPCHRLFDRPRNAGRRQGRKSGPFAA